MNGESSEQMNLIQQISYPLYECKGWMKFLGVMSIIGGVVYAITLVGLIIAWLPIWIGVLLFQSAAAAEDAYESASEYELHRSLSKLKTYFIIMGVLALLSIIFMIIAFILGFFGAFFSQSGFRIR